MLAPQYAFICSMETLAPPSDNIMDTTGPRCGKWHPLGSAGTSTQLCSVVRLQYNCSLCYKGGTCDFIEC